MGAFKTIKETDSVSNTAPRKYEISYLTVIILAYCHIAAFYGMYLGFTQAKWKTLAYTFVMGILTGIGTVVGAHKLWTHQAFKATKPLEIFLVICQSITFQFSIYKWVIIHRQHHKYSDTASDPHDASRGLFYSHIGWMLTKKPGGDWDPQIVASAEDIKRNPILDFQRRNASWLLPTAAFVVPTIIPLLWGETLAISWHLNMLRFVIALNQAGAINSFSHTIGYKPYDTRIRACTTWLLIFLTLGEGHHNFHHVFPTDYRSCEKAQRWTSFMALFVDLCAWLGLAYDLKVAREDAIRLRKEKRGDGSDFGNDAFSILRGGNTKIVTQTTDSLLS